MKILGPRVRGTLRSLLFATDFSPDAERAETFLTGFAKHSSAKVQLLHVLDLSAVLRMPDAGICVEIAREDAEDKLAAATARLTAAGVEAEPILTEAMDPTKMILEVAHENGVDMIVMGTRGLGALGRLALGSVTQQLIHESECPVLTIGPHVKTLRPQQGFQRIVCATDFSEDATAAVEFALFFAQSYQAHMFLCHVLPRPDSRNPIETQELNDKFKAELQRLIPGIAREWCDPECVLDHGYAVDGILLLGKRVKADLIVLGSRRSSNWFANLKAGIAFEVIRAAECPVLTVRSP